jgi:hypothetical protein
MRWTALNAGLMLTIALPLAGSLADMQQPRRTAVEAVDHLLLGVSDLDAGIAWVEKITGVKAGAGGSHPGVGTRNALLALGGSHYLEIIAPDPAQAAFNYRIDLRTFKEPRLIGWAAATTNIEGIAAALRGGGQPVLGPRDGSRARPDGRMLRWRTLGLVTDLVVDGVDPVPFFIEWSADTVHPSTDSPKGCELQALEIRHPRAAAVTAVLERAGLDAVVRAGDARLTAVLQCPSGRVELR